MHDDSDVIQASTPGNIRLPRLWANSKEMKTDTYSDRFSTTCRNDSTMSSNRTSNKSGNRLQHEGNSCLRSGVSGRQQNEVSHRGNPPHSNAYVHRTNVHQTGQKTGHRSLQQAVSYSEIPLKSSTTMKTAISPSRNPAHHFRRLFDDSHALFVLNSVYTFCYNGTYPNKRSCYDAFTNRSENRSEKRPGIGS